MTSLYLVRHAKAGSRKDFAGDDRLRSLTRNGRRQAELLADRLEPSSPLRVLSSPYVRCIQTVEPLAERLGLEVEAVEELAEGAPFEAVLDLLMTLPPESVLCSHGDVIPDTIEALARRGTELVGSPDWRKGSVWVVTRTDDGFDRMEAWPPPG